MDKWYFSINDQEKGPYSLAQAKDFARENPGSYCWRQGFNDWRLVYEVPDIRRIKKDGITPFPPPPAHMISSKPSRLPLAANESGSPMNSASGVQDTNGKSSQGYGDDAYTEGIDFKIFGHETQFVEVELDPEESAVAEAGAMMYKSSAVEMNTIFGDGSEQQNTGIMNRLLGAGKRLLTSESLFTTVFTMKGNGKGRVAFAAPFPGTILALKLSDYGGKLICQKDSFLAGAKGVQIGIQFQQKILTGLFGGEGFIMQKLEGEGWVFVHIGGVLQKLQLAPGETLHVDTGCVGVLTPDVGFDIQRAGGVRTMLFGGEGLFFASLTGPGTVWLQSLPFSRLAGRMLASASSPQAGRRRQGEGSILGSIGDMLDGDS